MIIYSLLSFISLKTVVLFPYENFNKYVSTLHALLSGERYTLPAGKKKKKKKKKKCFNSQKNPGVFPSDNKTSKTNAVYVEDQPSFRDNLVKTFLCDLMIRCWDKNPQNRPSSNQIVELLEQTVKKKMFILFVVFFLTHFYSHFFYR